MADGMNVTGTLPENSLVTAAWQNIVTNGYFWEEIQQAALYLSVSSHQLNPLVKTLNIYLFLLYM